MVDSLLLLDDEEEILRSLERLFSDRDWSILKTRDPRQALAWIEEEEIGLVISDHRMPGTKGTAFLAAVRDRSPDTTRILMTAHADLETAIEAINEGEVYRFVQKPWDNELLTRLVEEGLERHRLVRSLRRADEGTLLSIGQAIELKDPYTRGHCTRVARYALWIAEAAGIPAAKRKEIEHGSWLHDCGKIGLSEAILNKHGPLTKEEYELVRKHPSWGAEIARQARLSEGIINVILYHHERYDGRGYPAGKRGRETPKEARVVAIADVFDALVTDRPYRKGLTIGEALEVMSGSMRGTVLDPDLLDLFLSFRERLEDRDGGDPAPE